MAYPETYTTMQDLIEQKLQDTGNAVFSTTELDLAITEGLREISQFSPHIYMVEYLIESRKGTATSTSVGNLVDATNDQFVSGDVGKIVFNTTDRTWAYITTYTDAETVALSKDIMASGETYRIFNKNCNHQKEFYLGDMPDWLWIDKIEFPAQEDPPNYVKWLDRGRNVVRLDIDDEPDNTKEADAKKQIWVFFAMRHKLSQMDDLSGTVNGAHSEAATSLVLAGLGTGSIEMGQEFTIADERSRAIYIVTANATISTNAATISIWPPLESSVATSTVVTFISSTLTPKLEGIFADLVAGKAAMSKARSYINKIGYGPNPYRSMWEWGKLRYEEAKKELGGLRGFIAPSVCLP